MTTSRGVVLIVGQVVVFVLALTFGFRMLAPRRQPPAADLQGLAFRTAQGVIAYRVSHGSFSGVDAMNTGVPVPVGVGLAIDAGSGDAAAIEVRGNGGQCAVRVRVTDTVPPRPSCR